MNCGMVMSIYSFNCVEGSDHFVWLFVCIMWMAIFVGIYLVGILFLV